MRVLTGQAFVEQLRSFAQHNPHRSAMRVLLHAAADALETAPVEHTGDDITVDAIEKALGGRKLMRWQVEALEGKDGPHNDRYA